MWKHAEAGIDLCGRVFRSVSESLEQHSSLNLHAHVFLEGRNERRGRLAAEEALLAHFTVVCLITSGQLPGLLLVTGSRCGYCRGLIRAPGHLNSRALSKLLTLFNDDGRAR